MRAALAAPLAAAFAVVVSACDPTTHRPTFTPRPEAATTELELAVPAATHALASALEGDSVPLSRMVPRDGFLETPWLDAATMKPATGRPVGPSVVRLRGWVDPSRYGFSRLTVEVVYRTTVDPSLPVRETEAEVPWSSPARARVRALLGKLGGTPVDQPEVRVARAPARKVADTTHVEGERLPLPSPVSVDSGALLRGRHDSVSSRAPAAAPNQGQRAAAPPAIVQAMDSTRRRAAVADTVARRTSPAAVIPAPTSRAQAPPAPASAVQASPAPASPVPAPSGAAPSAATRRPASRYTVQVAAARTRAEADPIAATFVAAGFAARVVTSSGWFKVWVGDYPTTAAADSARRAIQARQGGAPFVIRE